VGLLACAPGCDLKTVAMKSLADSVAEPGDLFAREDDPELVRESLPLLLKIMEMLRDGLPKHEGIRLGLARGFTSYAVGFLLEDADRLNEKDVAAARPLYRRVRRLLLRANQYGTEALELASPGLKAALEAPDAASPAGLARLDPLLARLKKDDVPLLYWTGAALGAAVSVSKSDMATVGKLPIAGRLVARALALDEAYDEGALHEFMIAYQAARSEADGGGPKVAKKHYDRALELSQNKKLGPHVTWAESVSVANQDKKEFDRLLDRVLAYDVDADRPHRLTNLIAQRRAEWLKSRAAELFAEAD
jgi:predicted anti-sigma-YlaC factor YlaD